MTQEEYVSLGDAAAVKDDARRVIDETKDAPKIEDAKPIEYWNEKTGVMNANAPGVDQADVQATQEAAARKAAEAAPAQEPKRGRVVVQTPGRTSLYFGNDAGMPEAANAAAREQRRAIAPQIAPNAAANDATAWTGNGADANAAYQNRMVADLQSQGFRARRQNASRNDAIVTDAFGAIYNQWKNGGDVGADGNTRVGLVRDALRAVNDQLKDNNASYRVMGMSVVGKKEDGNPVFRVVTVDRDGRHHLYTRSLDEIYGVRLNALNGLAGVRQGETAMVPLVKNGKPVVGKDGSPVMVEQRREQTEAEKRGVPSASEASVIDMFGDRRGVRRRYDMLNADAEEKARANKAHEALVQKQLDESRRATDERNKIAAMELIAQWEKANGGRKMTAQEYMQTVLTNPKLVEQYRTVPEFERNEDGSYKEDPKTKTLIPKMVVGENGNEVQATRNLTDKEVYERIKNEYRTISAGQEGGAKAQNPLLEMLYNDHPDWRPKESDAPANPVVDAKRAALEKRRQELLAASPASGNAAQAAPAPSAAPAPTVKTSQTPVAPSADYGMRNDGETYKGTGWLGELKTSDGGVATEYTSQSDAVKVDGKRIDFPTLVPGLSQEQVSRMVNDIIPNNKPVPDDIMQVAVEHANKMIAEGKSVFKNDGVGRIPTAIDYAGLPKDLASYSGEDVIRPVVPKKTQAAPAQTENSQANEPFTISPTKEQLSDPRAEAMRELARNRPPAARGMSGKNVNVVEGIARALNRRNEANARVEDDVRDAMRDPYGYAAKIAKMRDDIANAKDKEQWENRMVELFRMQRERREGRDAANRMAAEKARIEKRDAEKAAFVSKNIDRLQRLYESGDVDAIRNYSMRDNNSWSDADVEDTTRLLESLFR